MPKTLCCQKINFKLNHFPNTQTQITYFYHNHSEGNNFERYFRLVVASVLFIERPRSTVQNFRLVATEKQIML